MGRACLNNCRRRGLLYVESSLPYGGRSVKKTLEARREASSSRTTQEDGRVTKAMVSLLRVTCLLSPRLTVRSERKRGGGLATEGQEGRLEQVV